MKSIASEILATILAGLTVLLATLVLAMGWLAIWGVAISTGWHESIFWLAAGIFYMFWAIEVRKTFEEMP